MATKDKAAPKFEEHLAALEKAVSQLESGALGLEESLEAYEGGVAALKRCHEILDRAEKKVQQLLKGECGDGEAAFDVKKTADREKEEREESRKKKGNEEIDF